MYYMVRPELREKYNIIESHVRLSNFVSVCGDVVTFVSFATLFATACESDNESLWHFVSYPEGYILHKILFWAAVLVVGRLIHWAGKLRKGYHLRGLYRLINKSRWFDFLES